MVNIAFAHSFGLLYANIKITAETAHHFRVIL